MAKGSMMSRCAWLKAATVVLASSMSVGIAGELKIPEAERAQPRAITIDDMVCIRRIDSIAVAPDGRHFAIFVHQADPETNDFRTAWFAGDVQGGALVRLGDGGKLQLHADRRGTVGGDLERPEAIWSPDGDWVAYPRRSEGEVQLWRSRADGSAQTQVTHNASDVGPFAWSADGRTIYFEVGVPRSELHARAAAKEQAGYAYDEDFIGITDLLLPQLADPEEEVSNVWTITLADGVERLGGESERTEFDRERQRAATRGSSTLAVVQSHIDNAAMPPITRPDGALAWLVPVSKGSFKFKVMTSATADASNPVACAAAACTGYIQKLWWSDDGEHLYIWRHEQDLEVEEAFYSWSPKTGKQKRILDKLDDYFASCDWASNDHLICLRETPTSPRHVVTVDLRSGNLKMVADVNPEFRNIRFGRIERFEWDVPKFAWNEPGSQYYGIYPSRAFGHILYPPDFDPRKKYPALIEPYYALGFENYRQFEYPLHVFAAQGIVVLNTQFPMPYELEARFGETAMAALYSTRFDYPHMTLLMESTVRALDVATARGFIDSNRVGIGGVSHGTFIPLYMLQKHDRITAISISSSSWGPLEYYWGTARNRQRGEQWLPKPEGEGREFWRGIDIADHVDTIEAPILMNLPANESVGMARFIRHLSDAGKPYDTYVFAGETHVKWQPAHLRAIQHRNLDWFRFWLQDYEDPAEAKKEQYARWEKLRDRQCKNPRALKPRC